jgi:hypothetical protein
VEVRIHPNMSYNHMGNVDFEKKIDHVDYTQLNSAVLDNNLEEHFLSQK